MSVEDLENLVGTEENDPLAEPGLPLEQPEEEPVGPSLSDRIGDIKDKADQAGGARNKFNDWRKRRAERKVARQEPDIEKAKHLKKVPTPVNTGGQVAKGARGELGGATLKAGAKLGGKVGARLIPVLGEVLIALDIKKLLTNKKFWAWVVGIIATIILLISLPLLLIGGKGAGQYPSTQAQQQQATLVSAVAGDLVAGRKVTQEGVHKIKGYYRDLVQAARDKNAAKAAEAEKRFKALGDQLDQLINLSGDPQKKLLAQINAEEKQIFKDYSALFPVGGTCAELKPFIDSGQFKIGSVNGKSNAKNVVEGVLANKIGEVWPASPGLCATLIYLLKNGVKIGTNTFSLGHEKYSGNKTSGTTISQHWCGEAIDIQSIDGVHVGKNDPTRKAMQLIKRGWMAKVGAYESFGPFYDLQLNDGKSYLKDIGGHDDHIHLAGSPLNGICYGKR